MNARLQSMIKAVIMSLHVNSVDKVFYMSCFSLWPCC